MVLAMSITYEEQLKQQALEEYKEKQRKELSDKMRALARIRSPKRRKASIANAKKARKVWSKIKRKGRK